MRMRFLGDANVDQDMPKDFIPNGIEDPEVLAIAARLSAVLVTHDVRTMPFHFADFQGSRFPPL